MSEPLEEALRRQNFIQALRLTFAGKGRCVGCWQQKDLFSRRLVTPRSTKERCLDCWRARQ
jgi:hypothetical protein